MILAALLIAATQPPAAEADVTVTARPLSELEREWRACIENGCPPKVEIERAMALAEAQLGAGDYPGSWRTVRRTKDRTLKHADELPLDVARVARASSRMANLNGVLLMSRVNAFDTAGALRAGLPDGDARILLAQLDIGDAYVPERKYEFALAKYERVGREAKRKGVPAIAAEAEFRATALRVALSEYQGMYRPYAKAGLARIAAATDPAYALYRDIARLIAINLLPEREQKPAIEALLPTLAPRPPGNLLLVYAPPIDFERLVVTLPAREAAQQWLDVRYTIGRDGRVSDVRAARRSPHLDPVLGEAAVANHAIRRYAPLALPPSETGVTRFARYTFVFDEAGTTESRLKRRSSRPRVDVFDLGSDLVRRDS